MKNDIQEPPKLESLWADLAGVAKALGKPTAHVQPRMRLQKW